MRFGISSVSFGFPLAQREHFFASTGLYFRGLRRPLVIVYSPRIIAKGSCFFWFRAIRGCQLSRRRAEHCDPSELSGWERGGEWRGGVCILFVEASGSTTMLDEGMR